MLKKLSQVKNKKSLSNKLRRKRFLLFLDLINKIPRPVKILDIGGTENFWKQMNFFQKDKIEVTLFNIKKEKTTLRNFSSFIGNATDLSCFRKNQFDIVFSNSTIEHLFSWRNQKKMAKEAQRVGKKYFIQTPNKYFPIEPHFLFPFFQFLPRKMRIWLQMHFDLGWRKKKKNQKKAKKSVTEIRLLSSKEIKKLFPKGIIHKEKFFGLTKSIIVSSGIKKGEVKSKKKISFLCFFVFLTFFLFTNFALGKVEKMIIKESKGKQYLILQKSREIKTEINKLGLKSGEEDIFFFNIENLSKEEKIEMAEKIRKIEQEIQNLRVYQLDHRNNLSLQIFQFLIKPSNEILNKSWLLPVDLERFSRNLENLIFDNNHSSERRELSKRNIAQIFWRMELLESLINNQSQ